MGLDVEELRARLGALGFDVVRFARAGAPGGAPALQAWLKDGYHADLGWMERTAPKRVAPELVLPGTRSVILLGVNYAPAVASVRGQPVWARYAQYSDYHDTIHPGLVAAGRLLEEIAGLAPDDYRYYTDTGPVLERSWAATAGVGFIGKNAMLISREYGNWLFLAAILVRLELPEDPPLRAVANDPADEAVGALCGKCTRCLEACPTQALPRPGVLDARRCISYHTIENKGVIPKEFRAAIGRQIYGCDICAEVCPWNRFAQQARSVLLEAKPALAQLTLQETLELTPERYAEVFRGTAVKRLKLRGLLRNACIVAANSRATECLPTLVRLASHPEPIVRAHAVGAVLELGGKALLSAARAAESDPRVLDEYTEAVEGASVPL